VDRQERWYLESLPLAGATVADVGANVGRLSQFFWEHVGPSGRVVSIEPQSENVAAIEARIRESGANNWVVKAVAVSDHAGEVVTRVIDVEYGKNSVVVASPPPRPSPLRGEGDLRTISCRVLQDLVPDATVVKLDIEGHEHAILPAAVPAMDKVKAWALELHMVEGHPLEATLDRFRAHGFELFAAGRKKDDASGAWVSVPAVRELGWQHIPGTRTAVDGVPGLFKMLHVLALRT
jgi:FkbM family methyltransferase